MITKVKDLAQIQVAIPVKRGEIRKQDANAKAVCDGYRAHLLPEKTS
jgi:hypothetical protein